MSRILLVGAGAVGGRAARQLVETPGVDELLVVDARPKRAGDVAELMGEHATTIDWQPGTPIPDGVDAVACAVPAGDDVTIVRDALEAGVPVRIGHRRHHRDPGPARARRAPRRTPACPSSSAPGSRPVSSDVLVRHAADGLDTIDDVNVARWGAAGDASASTVRVALADRGAELRDGEIVPLAKRGGEELIWFPNPVDARGCEPVSNGLELLLHAVPGLGRATIRFSRRREAGLDAPAPCRPGERVGCDPGRGLGHARPDRTSPSSTARSSAPRSPPARCSRSRVAALAGALPGLVEHRPGVHGLGRIVVPRAFLAELARRGVKVAVFEGVPVA